MGMRLVRLFMFGRGGARPQVAPRRGRHGFKVLICLYIRYFGLFVSSSDLLKEVKLKYFF